MSIQNASMMRGRYLVGSVGVSQGTQSSPELGERGVLANTFGTVDLHCAVDNLKGHGGHDELEGLWLAHTICMGAQG
jgi:hypothetical protein